MTKEFDVLKKILKTNCHNGKIYYLQAGGNWGDAIMRHGTIKFFKDCDIKHFEFFDFIEIESVISDQRPKYLIYGGGGGWCNVWNHSPEIILRLHKFFTKVIILPSTYEFSQNLPNCIYFSRDNLNSKKIMPHAIFCHDMAFYLKINLKKLGNNVGFFFRMDKESSGRHPIPVDNIDISLKSNQYGDLNLFIKIISRYRIIHTDRMHVAIVGALLGCEIHLYSGVYFKAEAVFLSTIKENFKNVKFIS